MKNLELLVNSTLLEKIYALCRSIPDVEWSGHLIYTMQTNGDTTIFHTHDIILADIGTSGYTEYQPDNLKMIEYMMQQENFSDLKMGHIHSHNKMQVYFSGQDTKELADNKDFFDGYLSVIVNNNMDIIAAFSQKVYEAAKTVTYKSRTGDCTVTYPAVEKFENRDVTVKFINPYREQIEEIKKKKEEIEREKRKLIGLNSTSKYNSKQTNLPFPFEGNKYLENNPSKVADLFSADTFLNDRFIEDSLYSFLAIPQKSTIIVDTFKIVYNKVKHSPEKFINYLKSRVQYPLEDVEIIDEVTSYLDQILGTTRMENDFLDQFNDALFDYGNKFEDQIQWDSMG